MKFDHTLELADRNGNKSIFVSTFEADTRAEANNAVDDVVQALIRIGLHSISTMVDLEKRAEFERAVQS